MGFSLGKKDLNYAKVSRVELSAHEERMIQQFSREQETVALWSVDISARGAETHK